MAARTPEHLTITAAQRLLRSGELTAADLAKSCLEAAGRSPHNALTGSVAARVDPAGQSGDLSGIPIIVKDNIHVAGLVNSAGTGCLAQFIPQADAPVVRRLRQCGANIIAKCTMHELSLGVTGTGSAHGTVFNAIDPLCVAGGSSSGVAVGVALGAIAGLGTDTGGSVRIPAALNGVVGFRPSTGRYPAGGMTPLSKTRDTVGPIAHCVSDVILLDACLSREPLQPAKPKPIEAIRLGVLAAMGTLDSKVQQGFSWFCDELTRHGAILTSVTMPDWITAEADIGLDIVRRESRHELKTYLQKYTGYPDLESIVDGIHNPQVKAFISSIAHSDHPLSKQPYQAALNQLAFLRYNYEVTLQRDALDGVIFPTTPARAGPVNDEETVDIAGAAFASFTAYTRFTAFGSLMGSPGISIPLPVASGELPIGVALDGRRGMDRDLLEVALTIEGLLRRS